MSGNRHDDGPIWEDADRNRSAPALLGRIAGLAVAGVVALGVAVTLVVEDRVEAAGRDEALAFAAAVSLAPRDAIPDLIEAAGAQAIIARDGNTVEIFGVDAESSGRDFDRWRIQVRNRAFATEGRRFTSDDPNGATWWFSQLDFRDDQILVVGTPRASGMYLARSVQQVALAASLAAIAGILVLWAVAYRRAVVPIRSLVDASEDLRVRGELRRGTSTRLKSIASVPEELQSLAITLQDLERESQLGNRRVDSLLAAVGALGGSLDQSAITTSTLEHLERVLQGERSAILRFDVHASAYEVIAVHGHGAAWYEEMNVAHADPAAPIMRALRERVPVQVPDTESEVVSASLRDRGRRHGYRSVLAVPLADDLEHPTVLVMHSPYAKTYSFDEIELSRSFASIAGAALRNAELFERTDADLQQQTSRLESIVESVEQGLVVEGGDGNVLYANAAVRRLLPAELRRAEGVTSTELVAAVLDRGNAPFSASQDLADLSEGPNRWVDVDLTGADGSQTFRVRKFVVRNAHGTPTGRGQTWTDVTRDRDLERMKSGLLAAVSHEFRTPLALIKGYATTLMADDVEWTRGDQHQFLSLVSSEADRLTALVQRILDMRRIDAGMVSLQLMPVWLDFLIDAVLDSLPHERDRIIVKPLPQITLNVDAARIVIALRNLVENACKYSPVDEPVTIWAEVSGETVELAVCDRGPGIDPEIRDRIFDTFVRGESGLATVHGGVGLGLAISRGFVEAHNGRLYISESSGDVGTEFRLQLPYREMTMQPESVR